MKKLFKILSYNIINFNILQIKINCVLQMPDSWAPKVGGQRIIASEIRNMEVLC